MRKAPIIPPSNGVLTKAVICFFGAWLWVAITFLMIAPNPATGAVVTAIGVLVIGGLWLHGCTALIRHWSEPTLGIERWTSLGLLLLTAWPVGVFVLFGLSAPMSD